MAIDQPSSNGSGPDLAAAKADLLENGYTIVPDVLPPDRVAFVLERLWKAAEESRRVGNDTYVPALDPNESNVRVFYLLERDVVFRELIQHPIALEMVQSLIGKDPLVSNFTANIARPGSGSMMLHSDQSLVVPGPWTQPWAINIVWCLHDVYFENGATLFIPGSQKWTTRSEVPENAFDLLKPFTAKAGSIVVLDGRTWHTSGSNITKDQDRALLFGYYTVPFLRQQINWAAALSDEVKKSLGPDLTDLLGVGIHANVGQASEVGIGMKQPEKA